MKTNLFHPHYLGDARRVGVTWAAAAKAARRCLLLFCSAEEESEPAGLRRRGAVPPRVRQGHRRRCSRSRRFASFFRLLLFRFPHRSGRRDRILIGETPSKVWSHELWNPNDICWLGKSIHLATSVCRVDYKVPEKREYRWRLERGLQKDRQLVPSTAAKSRSKFAWG